jgi:Tfp pilus assembly protein PilO
LSRQSKLIILVAYLLLLAVFMFGYRANRAKKVKQLRSQIAQVRNEQEKTRRGEAELARLSRLFPVKSDSAVVIEDLYRYAKEAGLKQHELVTEADKKQGATRPGVAKESAVVASRSIKISVAGNFRQIAEYIRRVQNMDRFNRVVEFKLVPDAAGVKGTMTLELFAMAVKQ